MTKAYRTVLVEDSPIEAELLKKYTGRIPFLSVVGTFDNGLSAQAFLKANPPDLLVLDIYMPGLSGLELLRSLNELPAVILTTSSLTDSLAAYELGVADYLVKPYSFERFLRAINRALSQLTAPPLPPTIYFKEGRESVRVILDEIIRIEAFGGFCRVFLPDRMLLVTHTIAELTDRLLALSRPRFLRVHRSHLVAVGKISRYSSKEVHLGTQRVPIGGAYLSTVQAALRDEIDPQN